MFKNSKELSNFVRKSVVQMTHDGNSSHVGSCLSIADILSVIYFDYLNTFPKNPTNEEILEITNKWIPYRTIGTWYIWRGVKNFQFV